MKQFKRYGRGGRKAGTMNGAEKGYAAILANQIAAGTIHAFWFEAVTFKLAEGCRYTPDFMVMLNDGAIEFHEVKAAWKDKKKGGHKVHVEDDARVKILVAADKLPFVFKLVYRDPVRGWVERLMGDEMENDNERTE